MNTAKKTKTLRYLGMVALLAFAFSAAMEAFAKDTFFSMDVGTVQTYASKNKKGKIDGQWRNVIKDVKTSGNETTISYVHETLDKKGNPENPPVEASCKVVIKGGIIYLDMTESFASIGQDMKMDKSMVEITGVPMELASDLQPGQTIKDANMTMAIDAVFTKIKTIINTTDGKCLAIEDVKTSAGTFKCHKITQTSHMTVMGSEMTYTTIVWYALGVGMVKTEIYDEDNELQNTVELVQVTK